MIEDVAREDCALDIDDGLVTRADGESVGAADTLRIEQRMRHDLVSSTFGRSIQKAPKAEFLAARVRRPQGEARAKGPGT